MLEQMGFMIEEIEIALRLSNNDMEKAVQYLTREIVGLDASKPTSSLHDSRSVFSLSGDGLPSNYIESDEEELNDLNDSIWRPDDAKRVQKILEHNRNIFYRKNGSLSRCLTVAKHILADRTANWHDCIFFIDEILYFVMSKHVNPHDSVYIGEMEISLIEELYRAVIPVICLRLTYSPINVRLILMIDEIFNQRNKFFTASSTHFDLKNNHRACHSTNWVDISCIDQLDYKYLYAELVDEFVQTIIPCLDRRFCDESDSLAIDDILFLMRTISTIAHVLDTNNDRLNERIKEYINVGLQRITCLTEKEIRDTNIRRNCIHIIHEVVGIGEKFRFDIVTYTQESLMEFLKRCIKCPQMECMLHGLEELGQLAEQISRMVHVPVKPKIYVSEPFFKQWLNDNNVLQLVLTGNMDSTVYVERIQPILYYMTPELTEDDLKFVWSLRKGRMGVSVENFNRIMELIVKGLNKSQLQWVFELFKKSFLNRETRLFESIFNFCLFMISMRDRDDQCKLEIAQTIWELIEICRGPPMMAPFKCIEYGMKKHCYIMNTLMDKDTRDVFIIQPIEALKSDETFSDIWVVYLHIILDNMRKLYVPRRITVMNRNDNGYNENEMGGPRMENLRKMLKCSMLFDNLMDRIEYIRGIAHEKFDGSGGMNCQESMSNALLEGTTTCEGMIVNDGILTVPVLSGTDYGFLLDSTLRLMKWLIETDIAQLTNNYIRRLFDMFIFADQSAESERAKIFKWISELQHQTFRHDPALEILSLFCKLDPFTLQIDGLNCFSKFFEKMEQLHEEDGILANPCKVERMNECKLFLWKVILFNGSDLVVDKCIKVFCEREIISVDTPKFIRENTIHFLSVFAFYTEQLKEEYYSRIKKKSTEPTYNLEGMRLSEREMEKYRIPLTPILTDAISRAIDRLIRFLSLFVHWGNEKNSMVRQFPSHGSSVTGHCVKMCIELRNDELEELDRMIWKKLICDSNTTIGELKIRLAKRLNFHEDFIDFAIHKRDDDSTFAETQLRSDYLTLKNVNLASESDSIFLSEKVVVLVKPKRGNMKRNETRKAIHESYLPASIVSECNFYDLIHELGCLGDIHIRNSCRKLLLLLPTQPELLKSLHVDSKTEVSNDLARSCEVFAKYCKNYLNLNDPNRALYCLEALSSVLIPSALTPTGCVRSDALGRVMHHTNVFEIFAVKVLNSPETVPLAKISNTDRHAIFERTLQILRFVYAGRSTMIKSIRNEFEVRHEMVKISDQMVASRQGARNFDCNVDSVLNRVLVLPCNQNVASNNSPCLRACDPGVFRFQFESYRIVQNWEMSQLVSFLRILRDFVWVHVATELTNSQHIEAFNKNNGKTASQLIRDGKKIKERWGDDCRLVIVRKTLSLMKLLVHLWLESKDKEKVLELCDILFSNVEWINFYEDVLVNTHQEAYRKYMQEMIVKTSRVNRDVLFHSLKLLLDIFSKMPFTNRNTNDLRELEQTQRLNCDGIVQTLFEVVFISDASNFTRKSMTLHMNAVDWSFIGYSPIKIVKEQIESLIKFKPRFSQTNYDLLQVESSYAAAKMRLITVMLPFCSQSEIESCSEQFLRTVMCDFLFPEQPDVEESMFETESSRWEGFCREIALYAINSFCERSYRNMHIILRMIEQFPSFKRKFDPTYRPIIRPRAFDQVGMKNDGGTCYMNATIQQLVHVPGLAREMIAINNIDPTLKWDENTSLLFVELQKVFAQLIFSKSQACVPVGLWKSFRFEADIPLNTKQQHDAIDFYSILLDRCDNVIKKLNLPPLFKDKLFGKYSYEKICYGCWHRYKSPDEEFNCISLALHGDTLEEAIDSFLDAHVMEGENAYYCEKCDEKKTTLNRTSFLELPSTMTIQLKRFTYDVVNNMIKKDNQYFKFPFEIDMQPYMTSSRHVPDEHLQSLFDDVLYVSSESPPTNPDNGNPTMLSNSDSTQKKLFRRHRSSTLRLSQSMASGDASQTAPPKPMIYELVGVLAHSGIATAGHYYSFVKERREEMRDSISYGKWFNLNDAVSQPLNMSNIEDTWFGGTYYTDNHPSEERIRHWNAYVLFYEKKKDEDEVLGPNLSMNDSAKVTFQCFDDSKEKSLKEKEEEARRLRINMFHSMDDRLKEYLSQENTKFFKDRDFFSSDLYHVLVMSCLQLLKKENIVDYTVSEVPKDRFLMNAFEKCFSYIAKFAWQMFDDVRPKNFPRSTLELLKMLMTLNREVKYSLFKTLLSNDCELMNQLVDIVEQDIRYSFWSCLKHALRQWVYEFGSSPRSSLRIDNSPSSMDLDDDVDEDDDELDDDIDEEDESDSEESVENFKNGRTKASERPIDLSKKLGRRNEDSAIFNARMFIDDPYEIERKIVLKISACLRINRSEFNGRHYARYPLDCLLATARFNEFGTSFLLSCNLLDVITEFLFENITVPYIGLRYSENKMKTIGFWPTLPMLFFELMYARLLQFNDELIDQRMTERNLINVLLIYVGAREEADGSSPRTGEDCKWLHKKIVSCYVQQILILTQSGKNDMGFEYIMNIVQTILPEMCSDEVNHFGDTACIYIVAFLTDIARRLYDYNYVPLAVRIIDQLLYVPIGGEEVNIYQGVLPAMVKWLQFGEGMRAKRMFEALEYIRKSKVPEFVGILESRRQEFSTLFVKYDGSMRYILNNHEDETVIENIRLADDGEARSETSPNPLRRATTIGNLSIDQPIATARVFEMNEIDLKEHLCGDVENDKPDQDFN